MSVGIRTMSATSESICVLCDPCRAAADPAARAAVGDTHVERSATRTGSPLAAPARELTLGAVSLVVLSAFETLAVATAMPVVTAALDEIDWYALACGAPTATGIIGMSAGSTAVLAGLAVARADRGGPASATTGQA
jgi:hypothetical protein